MSSIAPWLVAASAAIVQLLGLIHLLYTFYGPSYCPVTVSYKRPWRRSRLSCSLIQVEIAVDELQQEDELADEPAIRLR